MDLHISQQDGVPVYLQIIHQIKNLIANGRLKADREIPPIRRLAEQLLINPNTVARAYRELESEGWVYKRRGAGTFVAERSSPLSSQEQRRRINERIEGLLSEAYQMNLPLEELVRMIRSLARQHGAPGTIENEE